MIILFYQIERNLDFIINDLAAKCLNKSELYNVLLAQKGDYLPLIDNVTHKYLKEIMIGDNL